MVAAAANSGETSNIISTQATEGALTGGFLFFAAGMALVGCRSCSSEWRPHGRAMRVDAEQRVSAATTESRSWNV
jgi:hypothetical protein